MNNFRFMRFQVYHEAKELHREIVCHTKNFHRDFLYLKDQARRSALSVVLNIAEGSAKDSDKDFNRYIQNALGSINELASCIDVAMTESLIDKKIADDMLEKAVRIRGKLGALSKTLKS